MDAMTPSDREEDVQKYEGKLEPLCLYYPDARACSPENGTWDGKGGNATVEGKGYKDIREKKQRANKGKMSFGRRMRAGASRRIKAEDTGRHLKSYLFASVKPERIQRKSYIPCLVGALETLKDAWAPNRRFAEDSSGFCKEGIDGKIRDETMKIPEIDSLGTFQLHRKRRSSMPEEEVRRYTMEQVIMPSEESEENQTMPEAISASPEEVGDKFPLCDGEERRGGELRASADEKARVAPSGTKGQLPRRDCFVQDVFPAVAPPKAPDSLKAMESSVLVGHKSDSAHLRVRQNEYDRQGKGIIKLKTKERGSQTGRSSEMSEIILTSREDTEDSHSSESLASSSPVELPRRILHDVSSSGNFSSESENMKCTCADLTSSKDTSSDIYRSGKSTLSQTISDKSVSTQDSTISIHSISTGGSTFSMNSATSSSSPELCPKTSAKETTTPEIEDPTPRICSYTSFARMRRCRNSRTTLGRNYLRYHRRRSQRWRHNGDTRGNGGVKLIKEKSREKELREGCSNAEENAGDIAQNESHGNGKSTSADKQEGRSTAMDEELEPASEHEWTKFSQEEIYMMQQMRHKRYVENNRRFPIPLPAAPDDGRAADESSYDLRDVSPVYIPRFSALPRTLSMIVNTSSGDTSAINSDSDALSLTDSLEDSPITRSHRFDTNKESKPVRGDVDAKEEISKKVRVRRARPRAFFVSIKDPHGEDEALAGMGKIPQPPARIVNRINERQLNLLHIRQKNIERKKEEARERKKQRWNVREANEVRRHRIKLNTRKKDKIREQRKGGFAHRREKVKEIEEKENETYREGTKTNIRGTPQPRTLVSSLSENEIGHCHRGNKPNGMQDTGRKGKTPTVTATGGTIQEERTEERTQKEETPIRGTGAKPQAVIHPSLMPYSDPESLRRKQSLSGQSRLGRFRQKFEIIPEEKSSSVSSTDEKAAREVPGCASVPSKLGMASVEPKTSDAILLRKCSLETPRDLLLAEFTGRSLRAIPCIRGGSPGDHSIIVLSPKDMTHGNSRKGRDALIAINREHFNRLSKGWMNFYMLKENSDTSEKSDHEDEIGQRRRNQSGKLGREPKKDSGKQKASEGIQSADSTSARTAETSSIAFAEKPDRELTAANTKIGRTGQLTAATRSPVQQKGVKGVLNESFRFHSSNTVLKPDRQDPKGPKSLSLPHLNTQSFVPNPDHSSRTKNAVTVLPKVPLRTSDHEAMDSDSTVYCQPPSFIVPRLAIDASRDLPSEGSCSDSDSDNNQPSNKMTAPRVRPGPPRKRGALQRMRNSIEGYRCSNTPQRGHPGWSVTVEGPLELSSSAPDLEMRVSFPGNGNCLPQATHSDSGFAEDGSHNVELGRGHPAPAEADAVHMWTVTVKNPSLGEAEGVKRKLNKNQALPELGQAQIRNAKKLLKNPATENGVANRDRKLSIYWPNIDINQCEGAEGGTNEEENLSVRGNAMPMEKKRRPPTMSEKGVTKGIVPRNGHSSSPTFFKEMEKLVR